MGTKLGVDYPVMSPQHRAWMYINWVDWNLTHRNIGSALADLEQVIAEVRKNFGEEEKILRDNKIHMAEHAREHYEFVERLFGFREGLHGDGEILASVSAFRVLCDDLKQHIKTQDSLMRNAVSTK